LLKPEVFCLPDISAAAALVELPDDYQAQQVPLLCDALALVERHQPLAFEHMREVVQVIAFKPPAAGDYSNVSFSDLPGAFIVSAVKNAYWMADALIHELLHNRLFFIIERNEILETGGNDDDEGEFYSPWRDDPRPLGGLLHAVYVYTGVCKFWLSVCESGETSGLRREYVEDQAVRAVLDLKVGISQLRRYGNFTEIGADLFKQMEREVDQLWTSARALKLSPSNPAAIARGDGEVVPFGFGKDGQRLSILETVLAHAEQNDTHRQVDLKSALNLS
jgi:HEXXH motif-containing protein